MNGEINSFPFMRNENAENKFEGFNDFKTAFSHLETLKRNFLSLFVEHGINEVLPVLFELDNDFSLKSAILKIILQLLRYNPKEMIVFFKLNSPFVTIINCLFNFENYEAKPLSQLGYLILIELLRYFNSAKMYFKFLLIIFFLAFFQNFNHYFIKIYNSTV